LTNEVTLPEANVMRFVRLDKDYLGAAETRASAQGDLPWICAYLEIESDGVCDGHGGEAVRVKGEVVGATASVAFGHTVGKILAFAYLKPHAATPETEAEVVIAGVPRRARVLGQAAYDPLSEKPRTDARQAEQEPA
jgi:dimethylglycine dehydrogenase